MISASNLFGLIRLEPFWIDSTWKVDFNPLFKKPDFYIRVMITKKVELLPRRPGKLEQGSSEFLEKRSQNHIFEFKINQIFVRLQCLEEKIST
jgi:hypothetical protein